MAADIVRSRLMRSCFTENLRHDKLDVLQHQAARAGTAVQSGKVSPARLFPKPCKLSQAF